MRLAFTEGKWQVLPIIILIVILAWFRPIFGLIPLALLLFVIYFFRDPHREQSPSPKQILSAADGTVTKIQRVDCEYVGKNSWEVSIFMSPFNVHVNRSPIQGTVEKVEHVPGKFLPAMNPEAPLQNEKHRYYIQGAIRVKIVQVAGIVARRTVNWVLGGEQLVQGDKIGMIKFSSCTQVVFPSDYTVLVSEGDRTRAGLTPIGEEL
jgi:phosphatidylserine decarboxylase